MHPRKALSLLRSVLPGLPWEQAPSQPGERKYLFVSHVGPVSIRVETDTFARFDVFVGNAWTEGLESLLAAASAIRGDLGMLHRQIDEALEPAHGYKHPGWRRPFDPEDHPPDLPAAPEAGVDLEPLRLGMARRAIEAQAKRDRALGLAIAKTYKPDLEECAACGGFYPASTFDDLGQCLLCATKH